MKVVAVVPVRAPGEGKSRLAGILSPRRRADLVRGMLARVLSALGAARRIDEVWVVTPDPTLELPRGVRVLHDHGTGLNTAVQLAAQRLAGRADAMPRIVQAVVQKHGFSLWRRKTGRGREERCRDSGRSEIDRSYWIAGVQPERVYQQSGIPGDDRP